MEAIHKSTGCIAGARQKARPLKGDGHYSKLIVALHTPECNREDVRSDVLILRKSAHRLIFTRKLRISHALPTPQQSIIDTHHY
jgi:hypothetical protein